MGDSDSMIFITVTSQKQLLILKIIVKERPDEKAISDCVNKNFATNINESFIDSIIKK